MRFFGVEGEPEYEDLFRLHRLAHKSLPGGGVAFDGAFVDGAANYGKLVQAPKGKLRVAEMKARSFRRQAKEWLGKWLLDVYRRDRFEGPPPPVQSGKLLGVSEALLQARRALGGPGPGSSAIVPLGFMLPSLASYKLIKPSAFVFRSARQRKRILADWHRLARKTECGPELLGLRTKFRGSLSAVAAAVYRLIGRGGVRLTALNVDRLYRPGGAGLAAGEAIRAGRAALRRTFGESVVASGAGPLTGLVVDSRSLQAVSSASESVS
jgi:hypothetical protein